MCLFGVTINHNSVINTVLVKFSSEVLKCQLYNYKHETGGVVKEEINFKSFPLQIKRLSVIPSYSIGRSVNNCSLFGGNVATDYEV